MEHLQIVITIFQDFPGWRNSITVLLKAGQILQKEQIRFDLKLHHCTSQLNQSGFIFHYKSLHTRYQENEYMNT